MIYPTRERAEEIIAMLKAGPHRYDRFKYKILSEHGGFSVVAYH